MHKIGIIGFGKMGMLHGALLNGSGWGKVVAICDKSFAMRVGFKKVYPDAHMYKDARKMVEKEDLDIVIVTTPTFNHMESALLALNNNCHVFIEKPLAITSAQAEKINEAAEEKHKVVQVGFCNRFASTLNYGKKLIEKGEIGNITQVDCVMYISDVFEPHVGWRYKKSLSGGGVLLDFGIHLLDILLWYFGAASCVRAEQKRLYSKEVEDELSTSLLFESGVRANLDVSWSKKEYRKSYTRLNIIGDAGKIEATDQTLMIYDGSGRLKQEFTYPDLYDGCFMDVGGLLFSHQMESFMDNIDKNEVCAGASAKEAVMVQKMIEEIYQKAEPGS